MEYILYAEPEKLAHGCAYMRLIRQFVSGNTFQMKQPLTFSQIKEQEARSRMRLMRQARRSPQAAAAIQKRVSLVGNGAKWRITNFVEVARALAKRV
jgi:hypothetical protein